MIATTPTKPTAIKAVTLAVGDHRKTLFHCDITRSDYCGICAEAIALRRK